MILASHLRAGMVIRFEGQLYRVLLADYHPGQGKMGGVTHARLKNLATSTLWEHSFRGDLKLDDRPVVRSTMEFLYQDGAAFHFMSPLTYEQIELPSGLVGPQAEFLLPQMQVTVEFVEGQPVNVILPGIVEVQVAETAPPAHQQQDSTWKPARLANGVEVQVPPFVKSGDVIRVDLATLRYMDRAKAGVR